MKILVVDDSIAMRNIVKRTLRQAGITGHEITEAEDGLKALEEIRSWTPDLVLCDWNMPNMTGIELLEKLKEEGDVRPKFGFVTTEAKPEQRKRATDAGASFIITKPFTSETFSKILSPLLG